MENARGYSWFKSSLNHLVGDLRSTHGDNLASVVLYGSAAAGDHIERAPTTTCDRAESHHAGRFAAGASADARVAAVGTSACRSISLSRSCATRRMFFRLSFTRWNERASCSTAQTRFESLQYSDHNLRHQTEYELSSKLIQLRRLYIPASVSVEKLADLMCDSLDEFCGAVCVRC